MAIQCGVVRRIFILSVRAYRPTDLRILLLEVLGAAIVGAGFLATPKRTRSMHPRAARRVVSR
eukprot:SAG31_NODE_31688_length_365_cov_0.864662_2_plen_63_part_00